MLGLALLTLCIGIGVGAVLLIKKSAKEFAIPPVPPGTPIDAVTRKLFIVANSEGEKSVRTVVRLQKILR
jgi:hypothetical protein